MSNLIQVNLDDLKVGDVVGFCIYPTFGWHRQFRYPIVEPHTIKRITPKRTKFVLDGDIELDVRSAKQLLVVVDEETERQTRVAKTLVGLNHILSKIDDKGRMGTHIIEQKLSDEELMEYHKFMKSIYAKYIGGEL